jgi:hypothetical protein
MDLLFINMTSHITTVKDRHTLILCVDLIVILDTLLPHWLSSGETASARGGGGQVGHRDCVVIGGLHIKIACLLVGGDGVGGVCSGISHCQ